MFISFFPRPLPFVVTAVLWGAFTIGLWYTTDPQLTELFGFHIQPSGDKMVGTVVVRFLWLYLYFVAAVAHLDATVSLPAVEMVYPLPGAAHKTDSQCLLLMFGRCSNT